MNWFWDPSFIVVIPAMLLAMYAQFKVSNTFTKYSKEISRSSLSGAEVAAILLQKAGISDVSIERIKGHLTDHYDPRDKVLRLSDAVYNNKSVAALGVAAHETGHAIQHSFGYNPLVMRNAILPAVMFGSNIAIPLIFIGYFLAALSNFGMIFIYIGIALFSVTVLFQIITLPVEFNASSRAIALLDDNNILNNDELYGAKKVLNAAALTYVAAAAVAISNLIRFLILLNGRKRD